MGPKYNHRGPLQQTEEEKAMKAKEAKTGVIWPQTKKCWHPTEAERGREGSHPVL